MQKLLLLITLLAFASCASILPKNPGQPKDYSKPLQNIPHIKIGGHQIPMFF